MNFNKSVTTDINATMKDFLQSNSDNISLDGYYIGVVVDVDDPDQVGRCRIRVLSVFGDDVPDDEIPWALPEFSFIGGNAGSFIVPTVDTYVYVRFDKGEIYLPLYSNKAMNKNHIPSNALNDYPNTLVFFETDNGDSFEVNTTQRTADFTHASGSFFHFEDDAIHIEHTAGNNIDISSTDIVITHASGSTITMSAEGNITIDSALNISSKHKMFLEDNGGYVIPSGIGPYAALPVCPFMGLLLTGQKCGPGPSK